MSVPRQPRAAATFNQPPVYLAVVQATGIDPTRKWQRRIPQLPAKPNPQPNGGAK